MASKSHRDLIAWQKAIDLVAEIYRHTRNFPPDELQGLTADVRRAGVAVAGSIADGHGRKSAAEFRHCLLQAAGSLAEVETQLTVAAMLGYLKQSDAEQLLARSTEVARILQGLLAYLEGPADNDIHGSKRLAAVAGRRK